MNERLSSAVKKFHQPLNTTKSACEESYREVPMHASEMEKVYQCCDSRRKECPYVHEVHNEELSIHFHICLRPLIK